MVYRLCCVTPPIAPAGQCCRNLMSKNSLCQVLQATCLLHHRSEILAKLINDRQGIMSGIKLDVLWSPNHANKFITIGTDITLYQVESISNTNAPQGLKISENTTASLLSINTENQFLKCVSWYPKQDYEHLLAVGQANGKVVFTSLSQCVDPRGFVGREFVPRHARQCNAVAWNPIETNLLAAGLDRYRAENSVLVWDIHRLPNYHEAERRNVNPITDPSAATIKPLFELGLSEITHSLAWFVHQPKTLVVGVSNKCLRVHDLRVDVTKPNSVAPTKAVYGLCADSIYEHRFSSYFEGQTMIWDMRNFEKPILTLNEPKHIVKICWCPTRSNLLATLGKENPTVKLYDIQQVAVSADEVEPTVMERNVPFFNEMTLSSFGWHSSQENRMITITSGGILQDFTIFERITLNWSPSLCLVWIQGRKTLQYLDTTDEFQSILDDIALKMQRRAQIGYGLKTEQLWQNGELASENEELRRLWSLLDVMKSLRDEGKYKDSGSTTAGYWGVRAQICGETFSGKTTYKSDAVLQPWVAFPGNVTSKIYRSTDRDKAMQLCGWSVDRQYDAGRFIDILESEALYQRAAAVAIFYLQIRRAIQALNRGVTDGKSVNLSAVAMALSGYTEEKNTFWREMCSSLRAKLVDPYLRAVFAFLTSENENYDEVLAEENMLIQDRVAFACIFLPDNKLAEFIERLTAKMIETGNLDGILLTGLTKEGIDLLQRYVDMTGDIQTASFVVVQALPSEIGSDMRVQQWIQSYRELLDQWRLWHQRALFDVHWHQFDSAWRAPQQVFISCNFCGKSIASSLHAMGRSSRPFGKSVGNIANKSKMTCCPGCRKPLPRCALCLIHMGTSSGSLGLKSADEKIDESRDQKLSTISNWFTWCQTCRHGGHANHMSEWFRNHLECPITACSCKCMSLDSVGHVEATN